LKAAGFSMKRAGLGFGWILFQNAPPPAGLIALDQQLNVL
jgi:hypothetical protein